MAVGSGAVVADGAWVGAGSSPQATAMAAMEATIRIKNNTLAPMDIGLCFNAVRLARILFSRSVRNVQPSIE